MSVFCCDHGIFDQRSSDHLGGKGCPHCGNLAAARKLRLIEADFIEKAKVVHGERYDYSKVEYVDGKTKVTIICREHGPFSQEATSHLSKHGCPDCAGNKKSTTEAFIEEAKTIHGDRYDYSQVDYDMNKALITIVCRVHGSFSQIAAVHLRGNGCADCAETGFNPSEPALLYYLAVAMDNGDTRYKIGITNRTVEERFCGPDFACIRIVKTWRFASGRVAREREAEILYQFAGERYYGPDILVCAGNTELFTHDVLGLDRRDDEHGQPTVDEDANLTSREIQSDFDF